MTRALSWYRGRRRLPPEATFLLFVFGIALGLLVAVSP